MKKMIKKGITLAMAVAMALSMVACGGDNGANNGPAHDGIILKDLTQAKNVILLIGDGMGTDQIRAGELFKGEMLTMQKFPYRTTVQTRSASGLTDSAAAATALATGTRTNNGIVGRDTNQQDLQTIVDIAHSLGKRTGILATEELYGATPMGFSAHAYSRNDTADLMQSAAESSNVNLFASYIINSEYLDKFVLEGYTCLSDADLISDATEEKVIGSYSINANYDPMMVDGNCVAFDRLVLEALEYLSQDEDGFFLMAEGSHIDHGGHNNDICYMLEELIAFDNAIQVVLEWAKDRDDTVVIVTADHETGGLTLDRDATHELMVDVYDSYGRGNCYEWTSKNHTNADVNFYINGANIDFTQYYSGGYQRIKNTDVFEIMKSLLVGNNA